MSLDDTAPGTLERRMASREEHLERIHQMKADGTIIDGGALLDDDGRMIGSIVLCEFPDRAAFDRYFESEVYRTKEVWGQVEVRPFRRVAWRQ